MKRFSLLLATTLFALTACDPQSQAWLKGGGEDPSAALDKLTPMDVTGVNATLEKQAKEALEKGDIRRAGQFYEQLIGSQKGTDEEKLRYKIGLSECMRRMGENDKALTAYEELLKEAPDNLDVKEGHALTLMAMGKATDAGQEFADIMKKDAKRWRTLNALGILFVTKNMIPEAMAYYTEALKYSKDNPAVLNNVGLSQAADHKYSRAIEALEQAARVANGDTRRRQIELNLAMVYGVSGDLDTAKQIASKYLQGPALDNNLGLYAHLSKDDALAKTYLNMALSGSNTFYERAWNNLDILDQNDAQENVSAVKKRVAPAPKKIIKPAPAPVSKKAATPKKTVKKPEPKEEELPED